MVVVCLWSMATCSRPGSRTVASFLWSTAACSGLGVKGARCKLGLVSRMEECSRKVGGGGGVQGTEMIMDGSFWKFC
jgi:hypothetical protein